MAVSHITIMNHILTIDSSIFLYHLSSYIHINNHMNHRHRLTNILLYPYYRTALKVLKQSKALKAKPLTFSQVSDSKQWSQRCQCFLVPLMPYDLRKKRRLGPTWWLIKRWDYSMAWFNGKASPETKGFSQQWGFPVDFPLNQTSYAATPLGMIIIQLGFSGS